VIDRVTSSCSVISLRRIFASKPLGNACWIAFMTSSDAVRLSARLRREHKRNGMADRGWMPAIPPKTAMREEPRAAIGSRRGVCWRARCGYNLTKANRRRYATAWTYRVQGLAHLRQPVTKEICASPRSRKTLAAVATTKAVMTNGSTGA
jgi:hypothetical protein